MIVALNLKESFDGVSGYMQSSKEEDGRIRLQGEWKDSTTGNPNDDGCAAWSLPSSVDTQFFPGDDDDDDKAGLSFLGMRKLECRKSNHGEMVGAAAGCMV